MLRRNSISRRKSTSSVHNKHDSIDPEVARQHAHVAANLAFARSQERSSADMSRSGFSSHNAPRISHQDAPNNKEHTVKRQQSVRFAGPNAVQRRQSIGGRGTQPTVQRKSSTTTLRPMAMTTNAPVPAAYRPPSRSSSIGKGSMSKATGDSFATALAAYDEYYTREDDVASTPSSYRRIRRSKSMFSPLKAPHVFYTNGTPDGHDTSYTGRSTTDSRASENRPSQHALRGPKSMSFLRSRRSTTFGARNDEAVQMARDRFFHQTTQQRLREQPSFLFRSKFHKPERTFRKSVRSSSGSSYGMSIASKNQPAQPKESVLRDKARKVSKTIKNKLKRVLGFAKDEPFAIPNQQVDAPETHVRKYDGDTPGMQETFSNGLHPDEASLLRVASRVPSIRVKSSDEKLKSHTGSVRSLGSEHSDDKSRVTSWTSTAANTVTSHGGRALTEREQQRLSIINENGTHITSSSFDRQRLPNQFSAYPIMHRPSKSAGNITSVDSARVYSALMKRLDENSPKAKLAASRIGSVESFAGSKQIPARGSSVHSSKGSRTPATIRQVTPEDSKRSGRNHEYESHGHQNVRSNSVRVPRGDEDTEYSKRHVQQWVTAEPLREMRMKNEDDVFSPKVPMADKKNYATNHPSWPESNAPAAVRSANSSFYTVPEESGLTPQEIAHLNEPVVPAHKGLRESRSTFFGGSNMTIARTTSPYRRAMAEDDYHSSALREPSQASLVRNPLYSGPDSSTSGPSDHESQKAYSESVYSRTTSGQIPAAVSAISLVSNDRSIPEMPFLPSGNGDAVILDRMTYRPAMPHGASHRVTGSNGSVEWKKWMSSEVEKLEKVKDNTNKGSYVNYALPTMPKSFHTGHIRENAQIHDDDVQVSQRKASTVMQPLGIVQQNAHFHNPPPLKPILKKRSAVSLVESMESESVGRPHIPPPPPPPPIPVHSPIRPMPSRSSLRSIATTNTTHADSAPNSALKVTSMSGRNLLHKRNVSSTTLRSTKSMETPAKLVKKYGRPLNNTPRSVGKQFDSTSTRSYTQNENVKMAEDPDDLYGADGAGLLGPDTGEMSEQDAQAIGSKRMVELFLNSRRKRIAGGSEENGAFI
ncbi:hypothetical protein LHYA1_G008074 [Lachnellula hyalina]|uniref:Uncharacterized protein n=1 Tax=Lachnellula hyalina TaxID=1316788 RepID=A0A8H8QYR1_9HELO|nr:uncharacterized protein LHYA1_G008074 [Lachnellula hyalina]TVY23779.1 hypothetical protein LHYA1_G008074 [Lachnellula hyalina]